MRAAEVAAHGWTYQAVHPTDHRLDQGNVDARDQREQSRIAPQVLTELIERPEPLLRLRHEVGIRLEGAEAQRVVDMLDSHPMSSERLTQQHILIAIMSEPLVERILQHQFPSDQEIGRVQVLIRRALSLLRRMVRLLSLLVEIAQVPPPLVLAAHNPDPAIQHRVTLGSEITTDILIVHKDHVAVDEQQQVILCLLREEVTDGSTPGILLPDDILAMPQRGYPEVRLHRPFVRRTIVSHDDLIRHSCLLQLRLQLTDQLQTGLIVSRYQDGYASHSSEFYSAKVQIFREKVRVKTFFSYLCQRNQKLELYENLENLGTGACASDHKPSAGADRQGDCRQREVGPEGIICQGSL